MTSKARLPQRVWRGSGRWGGLQGAQPAAGLPKDTGDLFPSPRMPAGPQPTVAQCGWDGPPTPAVRLGRGCSWPPGVSRSRLLISKTPRQLCAAVMKSTAGHAELRWQLSERMQKAQNPVCAAPAPATTGRPAPPHTADTGLVGPPPPHPPWASEHEEGIKRASPPAQGLLREHAAFLALF